MSTFLDEIGAVDLSEMIADYPAVLGFGAQIVTGTASPVSESGEAEIAGISPEGDMEWVGHASDFTALPMEKSAVTVDGKPYVVLTVQRDPAGVRLLLQRR